MAELSAVKSSGFDLNRLRAGVRPFRLHFFPRLRSTNDHAARMRREGRLFAPAIVLTGHQIAGRGRGMNTWWSNAGALTVTFVMPVEEHLSIEQLPLVAGLAARDAAEGITGKPIGLKWPNDIVYEGRKLAGLLCERTQRIDLIGLGLNVNVHPADAPPSLRQRITSLGHIAGRAFDITEVLLAMARSMYAALSRRGQRPFGAALEQYRQYHVLNRKRVRVVDHAGCISGLCLGLDEIGRLVIRQKKGDCHLFSGHVELLSRIS